MDSGQIRDNRLGAIPAAELPDYWKRIPVVDNNESLVRLDGLPAEYRLVTRPMYHERGIRGAISQSHVRQGVARRLVCAASLLPQGMRLVIWDAWRPLSVQRALFDEYLSLLKASHPAVGRAELEAKAAEFVSMPSEDPTCPSPHSTGGAVDVTIIGTDGEYLEMGTDFDSFAPMAHTHSLEDAAARDGSRVGPALLNRRLLYYVMTRVGFTNYPAEWWHYDHGNQFWAAISRQPSATYSACLPGELNGQLHGG